MNFLIELKNEKNALSKAYEEKTISMEEYVEKLPIICKKIEDNENYIENYLKISDKFPHLNLREIVELEEKIKENGGTITTHGGKFILSEKHSNFGIFSGYMGYNHYISWDCCQNIDNDCKKKKCLMNPNPITESCDNSVVLSLW